jgi:hypothetical protein
MGRKGEPLKIRPSIRLDGADPGLSPVRGDREPVSQRVLPWNSEKRLRISSGAVP